MPDISPGLIQVRDERIGSRISYGRSLPSGVSR